MAKHKSLSITFPLAGLNRRASYRQQKPYSTPSCLNVWPMGAIEGRERGGSRPGLAEAFMESLGEPVRFLYPMTLALGDGFTAWTDTFSGASMASAWSLPSWGSDLPGILPAAGASVDTSIDVGEALLEAVPIDTEESYAVEMYVVPWAGEHHGSYRLYLRMNDTTPDYDTDGVVVELTMTGSTGAYSGTLKTYLGGVETEYALASGSLGSAQPGWFSAVVNDDTISVYWCGVLLLTQAVDAHTGTRVGFGLTCTTTGGVCLANVFRVQYYSTGSVDALRTMLVASAGGKLYRETSYGHLEEVTTDLTLRDDVPLQAVQSGQKLYIADYGDLRATGTDGSVSGTTLDASGIDDWTTLGIQTDDDVVVLSNVTGTATAGTYQIASVAAGSITLTEAAGSGTCAYRIERAPKVYDPLAGTLSILTASEGQVPTGCPLICRYLDRIFLGGAEIAPHVWYAARQGDPEDWDYGADSDDTQRAVAGTSSEAGVPGSPLTALIPFSDDYLVMGCRDSMWRLAGDPVYDGDLGAISHVIGILEQGAWCVCPSGEMTFLSRDGLYILPAGGSDSPVSMSRETLPRELLNVNTAVVEPLLAYDVQNRGVHIFLTPDSANSQTHWWMDWENKTFWPVTYEGDHEPTAVCPLQATAVEESGVIFGGRDGTLRRLSEWAETDCGTVFENYVSMGPIPMAADGEVGVLMTLDAVLAEESGEVAWSVLPALTFEAAVSADASATGTWDAGLNGTDRPAARGQAIMLKLEGQSGRRWALEQVIAQVRQAGRRRIT